MYLKSLEIQGFKSFPDKITLSFDKGLTAVVGPNGSGKSNIGDSVRWVLGEQSTKTLRGSKMEDVIFCGTVSRKPMGFASVTLNIDNSDSVLQEDSDEVSVTRKLYRSGESEYMINGRQVRLKDINELFMDTGLGRDGYSIIGQGRIAEIIGAKSGERRDIFEEAAGISKFRFRKIEAERKLSSAQENILRLEDILSELESRIVPLKSQAQKAEKFLVLAEERKQLEVSLWVANLDLLKEKQLGLEDRILSDKAEYQNIENDIRKEEEKFQVGYRKMQECTVKSDEIRRKMLEEEKEASRKKSDIAVYENDIKHCNEAIETAKSGIKSTEDKKSEILERKTSTEKKVLKLKNDILSVENEISSAESEYQSVELKSNSKGNEINSLKNEINLLDIKRNEFSFTMRSAEKILEDEKKRLENIKNSTENTEKNLCEYRSKTDVCRREINENTEKIKGIENKKNGLEKLYSSRKQAFEQSKNELERVLYEIKDRQQRIKILRDLENSLEGFAGSVKIIMKAVRQGRLSGIYGTVAQNINVEKQYALAVETALGGSMQNIIAENEDIAKRCIRYLKELNGGRATFLPLTSVKGHELSESGLEECTGFVSVASRIIKYDPKFSGVISSLLGRTVIAEDIDSAVLIAKRYSYRFRIVTLDGQVINAGGSFTGGSAQKSAGVITRKNETESLEKDIEKLSAERDVLKEKSEKLRAESEKLRYDTENAGNELNILKNKGVRLEAEIASLSALSEQMSMQSENSEKLIADSERKISESLETLKRSEKSLAEIQKVSADKEKLLENLSAEREKSRLERAELSEKLSSLRMKAVEIQKDVQVHETEILHYQENAENLDETAKHYQNEIKRQQETVNRKIYDIERIKSELSQGKDNTEKYLSEIKYYQDMHNEQTRLVNEIQKGMKSLNDSKEKFSGEITRLEERRESVCRDIDYIIKQLMEVYSLTRSEAVAIAVKPDNMEKAQIKLNEIKSKIHSLGSVNISAVDEYREVSERYEFLSGQLSDVRKSKAELEKIILSLTDEMKRIFSESFSIINTNFKEIFRELFGGGNAELILTDPENVLESGIEISAAPPGKVIRNLISLSGGEQAFVAIAIYFAILKLRPAPFCILDEIDAALDEVNVRKYAQYLKKFTRTTQFILVTHRRSAMEEANVLYGVTMQEDGISKLLKMEQIDFQEDIADVQ